MSQGRSQNVSPVHLLRVLGAAKQVQKREVFSKEVEKEKVTGFI